MAVKSTISAKKNKTDGKAKPAPKQKSNAKSEKTRPEEAQNLDVSTTENVPGEKTENKEPKAAKTKTAKKATPEKATPKKATRKSTKKRTKKEPEKEKTAYPEICETLPKFISKPAMAELLGVSIRRIEQLVAEKTLENTKMGARTAFVLPETIRDYISTLQDRASGKDQKETIDALIEKKLRAEIKLKESQGELHELRTAISKGEYIAKEEIQADYTIFFIRFRNFALSIASRVSGLIAGHVDPTEARQIESELQAEIESMLSSFTSRSVNADAPIIEEAKLKGAGRPRKNAANKV